eukprot:7760258-Alexandrium_andersonii.AAC.1
MQSGSDGTRGKRGHGLTRSPGTADGGPLTARSGACWSEPNPSPPPRMLPALLAGASTGRPGRAPPRSALLHRALA